jgi:hypothetical protein
MRVRGLLILKTVKSQPNNVFEMVGVIFFHENKDEEFFIDDLKRRKLLVI